MVGNSTRTLIPNVMGSRILLKSWDLEMNQNIIQIAEAGNACRKNVEQWTINGAPQLIRDAGVSMGAGPNGIILACRWRYFAAEDIDGLKELASNTDCRIIRMPRSGQVQANWMAAAIDSGASALLIMGGHPATCHYSQGPDEGDPMPNGTIEPRALGPVPLPVDRSEGDRSERFLGSIGSW